MINIKSLAALLLFAGLGACQTTANSTPAPATIAPSTQIIAPSDAVPTDFAAFSGVWAGSWGGALDGKIAVQSVDPEGNVSVIYAWGDHPSGRFKAGVDQFDGRIMNNVLSLQTFGNGAITKFKMRSDGRLDASYDLNGDVSQGIFVKS